MSTLRDLQDRFQRAVLAGDEAILRDINDSDREKRNVLFGVYKHAYGARLAEILSGDYEMLHAYMGDAAFARLARGYIANHPSDRRNARWFGRHLPDYLRKASTFAEHSELAEIAALESALNAAFDGPDAEPLRTDHLAALPAAAWPQLLLRPHPTASRLNLACNAFAIWSALRDGAAPPEAVRLAVPQQVVVWRDDVTARLRVLEAEEAMMWDEAGRGVRFGGLCEMVATFGGEQDASLRAASYLKNWVDTGMLQAPRPL